ncbi:FAD-dependent oxidoreductase [Mesorhizobium sp. M0106]|uniref:FAD-dependent oxidoreductase n=1 Tax=Mesorhizobium sp. M0106 TaxID=2956880 RepID=UPI003337135A
MREVIVLGAGVVGLASAYVLARKGFGVTVIDAAKGPAEGGASFGNGAQLAYAYTDAMASPSMVANLPKYLLGRDPAFRLKLTPSLAFMNWGLRFLANSSQKSFERNTIDALKLAKENRAGLAELSEKVDFSHRTSGKMSLYSTHEGLKQAEVLSALKNRHGADQAILTKEQAIEREPALIHYGHSFVGALWSPYDESGDSYLFCQNLKSLLETEYGVTFMFGTNIQHIATRNGTLKGVVTNTGELPCTRAVLALGVWSVAVAKTAGIRLPIWPVQGYSMTIPVSEYAPTASVTDTARKTVFCRIGDRIRIAGLADIDSDNGVFKRERFNTLLETARGIFPRAGDYDGEVGAWTGLRPMTPNSLPIVGHSKVQGLFLNCGHGALGWTLSMATAARLANYLSVCA